MQTRMKEQQNWIDFISDLTIKTIEEKFETKRLEWINAIKKNQLELKGYLIDNFAAELDPDYKPRWYQRHKQKKQAKSQYLKDLYQLSVYELNNGYDLKLFFSLYADLIKSKQLLDVERITFLVNFSAFLEEIEKSIIEEEKSEDTLINNSVQLFRIYCENLKSREFFDEQNSENKWFDIPTNIYYSKVRPQKIALLPDELKEQLFLIHTAINLKTDPLDKTFKVPYNSDQIEITQSDIREIYNNLKRRILFRELDKHIATITSENLNYVAQYEVLNHLIENIKNDLLHAEKEVLFKWYLKTGLIDFESKRKISLYSKASNHCNLFKLNKTVSILESLQAHFKKSGSINFYVLKEAESIIFSNLEEEKITNKKEYKFVFDEKNAEEKIFYKLIRRFFDEIYAVLDLTLLEKDNTIKHKLNTAMDRAKSVLNYKMHMQIKEIIYPIESPKKEGLLQLIKTLYRKITEKFSVTPIASSPSASSQMELKNNIVKENSAKSIHHTGSHRFIWGKLGELDPNLDMPPVSRNYSEITAYQYATPAKGELSKGCHPDLEARVILSEVEGSCPMHVHEVPRLSLGKTP